MINNTKTLVIVNYLRNSLSLSSNCEAKDNEPPSGVWFLYKEDKHLLSFKTSSFVNFSSNNSLSLTSDILKFSPSLNLLMCVKSFILVY